MTRSPPPTDARIARLRSILDERELDGMLISRIANKRYFSGLRLMAEEESTWPGRCSSPATRSCCWPIRATPSRPSGRHGWEVVLTTGGIGQDLPPILERLEVVALGMEAEVLTHADWSALAAAARRRAPRDGRRDRSCG